MDQAPGHPGRRRLRATLAERVDAHLEAGADHVCLQVLEPDPTAPPVGGWRALAPALLGR